MKPFTLLFAAALMLTACGGNPFVDTPPVDPTDPTDPDAPVTVDPKVAVDLRSVTYNPDGAGSLTMNIDGLAGNTANVPFVRNGSLDVAGYEAYTYQNRITQRSYIALVATNARTSLLATAVSDGGQSNRHMGGGSFARLDVFTKPTTGTFSYAGTYAGILRPATRQATCRQDWWRTDLTASKAMRWSTPASSTARWMAPLRTAGCWMPRATASI